MNLRLLTTALGVALGLSTFVVPGYCSAIVTFSGTFPYTSDEITGSGATEAVTIALTNLSVDLNGTTTNYAGTYTETYTNGSGVGGGVLTVTGTETTGGVAVDMTIDEASGLLPSTLSTSTVINLYSAATSFSLSGSASTLLTQLGNIPVNPGLSAIQAAAFSVTASGINSTGKVSSFTSTITLTPEPSTFAMLGLALLAAIGYTTRKRSAHQQDKTASAA